MKETISPRWLKVCNSISQGTGMTVSWLVWIVMGFAIFEVFTRRVFNSPNIWTCDVVNVFYASHFMLLGGYTLLEKGHVWIDIFTHRLQVKTALTLQIINYIVFFFPFFIVFFFVGFQSAVYSWSCFEHTTIGLPLIYPVMKTLIPLASVLFLVQGIAEFGTLIIKVRQLRQ